MPTFVSKRGMSPRLFLLGTLLTASLHGATSLKVSTPFLPPGEEIASPTAQELEFVAYIAADDGPQFRLTDPARKFTTWVKLNERDPDLGALAKRYDAEKELLSVEYQGRALSLPLRRGKIKGSVMSAAGPALIGNARASNAAASPADQQKAFDNLVAEVQARRAAREQAATTSSTSTAPASTTPASVVTSPSRKL